MKKISILLILTLSLSLMLGCTKTPSGKLPDGEIADLTPGGNNEPEGGKTDPEQDINNGQGGTINPGSGENDPESGESNPNEGEKDPEGGESKPNEGEKDPESGESNPNEDEKDPEDQPEAPKVGNKVGDLFADLTLTTVSGETVNTADLRGKIIVFNIWATWCPPCKAELPDFNDIANEYSDDVVIIAAHSYDSGSANMPSYVASNFPDTKIIFAYDNALNQGYSAAGGYGYVPQTAIINKDGVIIYSDAGAITHSFLVNMIEANK